MRCIDTMPWCPLCEKKFQDRRGLHGHFRFVHGIEYGSGKPAKKTALTEAVGRSIRRQVEGRRIVKEMEERELEEKQNKKPRVVRGFKGDREYEREKRGKGKGVIFRSK